MICWITNCRNYIGHKTDHFCQNHWDRLPRLAHEWFLNHNELDSDFRSNVHYFSEIFSMYADQKNLSLPLLPVEPFSTNVYFEMQALVGTNIKTACTQAKLFTQKFGISVELQFNGAKIFITKDTTLEDGVDDYNRQIKAL